MKRNWWLPLLAIVLASAAGVLLIGIQTYQDAPPRPDFVSPSGEIVVSRQAIIRGQEVFHNYALMDYGSFFGDGGNRGPDFTAEALHRIALAMGEMYRMQVNEMEPSDSRKTIGLGIEAQVRREIRENRYDERTNRVMLTGAQTYAVARLREYYHDVFLGRIPESFHPSGYLSDPREIRDLSDFFFWGAWVCGAERPGTNYSYTHNWPYDETAGNTPSAEVMLWSVIGALGVIVGLGVVLYGYGRSDRLFGLYLPERVRTVLTSDSVKEFAPSSTQRASYKFFAVAAVLFVFQVIVGVLTVHDFVGFTRFFGYDLANVLPITVTRGWHIQLALLWISVCWIAASIFMLPVLSGEEPKGQLMLVNLLFSLLIVTTLGGLAGTMLGPMGGLGGAWYLFGSQGWEYLEMGKIWQGLLFISFALWSVIVVRGLRPALRNRKPWTLPYWLLYATLSINALFIAGFVATPETNFVIADFWRWMVIHMWAEAFFEVFTTVIVAYFMYLMGLVSQKSAVRTVYFAAILFLGSGLLGISHNFYWNAKPVFTLAVGSVFSTLQVVPLILLTLEAWRFRRMPSDAVVASARANGRRGVFGQSDAFLFLMGVNFWNFVGAGVFGFIINLPIVNYYEHGTYLTVNHGHAALMGVYGNLSLAAIVFCCRFLLNPERWSAQLVRVAFWSINLGLSLMVLLDLFPAGLHHLWVTLDRGLWFARSREFIEATPFQTMTWLRALGGSLFFLGGVIPLAWFLLTRFRSLKPRSTHPTMRELLGETREVGNSEMGNGEGEYEEPTRIELV